MIRLQVESNRESRLGRVPFTSIVAVCAALFIALLPGCGSSDDSSSDTSSNGSSGSSTPTESAPGQVTDYVEYTGGKSGAADDSLAPVTVGLVNIQGGGQASYPLVTTGTEAAIEYVNQYLGGIDGHPLKLETCFIATAEEEGAKCGTEMANNDEVKVVLFGSVSTGADAFHAANKGAKPVLITNAMGFRDASAKNTFIYDGSPLSSLGGAASYAQEIKAKNVAIIYPSGAATAGAAKGLEANLKAVGVAYKSVAFNPTSNDLTAPLVAAGAQTADLVVPILPTAQTCIAAANAADSLGVDKVLTFGSFCFTEEVSEALGGSLPEWSLSTSQQLLTLTDEPDVKAFRSASEKVGLSSEDALSVDAASGWSLVLTAARFLNAAGGPNATPAAVAQEAKAFTGPMLLGNPNIKCGSVPGSPGLCGSQVKIFTNDGNGNWEQSSDWLSPPVR